jgi:hypothetical protein
VDNKLRGHIQSFVQSDAGVLGKAGTLTSTTLCELVGFGVPESFLSWLWFANGCCVGHGGAYGVRARAPIRDLLKELDFYAEWRSRRWLPVAWDGFGNNFVLDCSRDSQESGVVWFFELASSETEPAFVAARSFDDFLYHFLSAECQSGGWPGASHEK